MPLKTPFSSAKSNAKPKGKTLTSSRGRDKGKEPPKRGRASQPPPPKPVSVSWWDSLSAERKLDVVGAVMAVIGLLTGLVLFSAQRSAITGSMVSILGRLLGWGIYILPVGLVLMGSWLILRRIEKLPRLSPERAIGIILFFLWLLAAMHSIIAAPEVARQAALDGAGGGYIGSFFERI